MASATATSINWKLYGGIALVGVIAYGVLGSDNTPPAAPKPPPKARTAAAPGQSIILPVDRNATPTMFQPVMFTVADSFVPLVFKSNGVDPRGPITSSELTIPSNFTGGESNWAFNGGAQVDGKWSALVENSTSGKSDYLHAGQKW